MLVVCLFCISFISEAIVDMANAESRRNPPVKDMEFPCNIVSGKRRRMTTTLTTSPRPDLEAHRKAVTAEFPEVVQGLVSILGRKLIAYIAGIKDARAIDRWLQNASPQKDAERRIRCAYHVASLLAASDTPPVVQAWFLGLNPELNDQVPITLLRDGDLEVDGRRVLTAARAFTAGA
jgi:hypothetical protein